MIISEKMKTNFSKAQDKYAQCTALRACIQAVPNIGGPIDTLLIGKASETQQNRIKDFLEELSRQMESVENIGANLENEAFGDLVLSIFERVIRTRSSLKRSRFARIITKQVQEGNEWDEAENAIRLLSGLEDIHIEVLSVALSAPCLKGDSFEGLHMISIKPSKIYNEEDGGPLALTKALPKYGIAVLRMCTAELLAKGLLHDEGIGRWDMGAMEHFIPTELAEWFVDWIVE
jgi:phage FluMu protein gp41